MDRIDELKSLIENCKKTIESSEKEIELYLNTSNTHILLADSPYRKYNSSFLRFFQKYSDFHLPGIKLLFLLPVRTLYLY